MSNGFKTATVASGDVPATQTNFPAYVNLARLGITTLAEAQSIRVYADSGKTTEWAREIVSVTEMHVKVPSLTNTVSIYVDWDGVRADYAVTDTYGRNAVWTNYLGVYHMQESSGNLTDSTVNGNTLIVTGSPTYSQAAIINGNGILYSGTGQYHDKATGGSTAEPLTIQAWAEGDDISGAITVASMGVNQADNCLMFVSSQAWALTQPSGSNYQAVSGTLTANTWYLLHAVFRATDNDREIYVDGTSRGTEGTTVSTPAGTNIGIGRRFSAVQLFDGTIDEVRFSSVERSANWILTEYNNQSDETGFWGTWTNVGGGGENTTNFFLMM